MKEFNIFSEHNLTEKVHYVYRVSIDGKYYIGKRTGFLNDLHTGAYTTSSTLVQEKLPNGMTCSKIKILQVFSYSKDALEFEKRILTRVNAKRNQKFLNKSNGNKDFCFKQHTEKSKEKMSKIHKERFNPETEEGRKNREINSKSKKEYYNTEEGIKRRENMSEKGIERFNPETEEGRIRREDMSNKKKEYFNLETEEGIKRREHMSNKRKEYFNPNTEEGRKNKEKHSKNMKKGTETKLQKRKDDSILGDLMFDEVFIKENFLIIDDKNNLRFLSSVYSKLSGYCESQIRGEKREGKLRFLYGIRSISLTEELENSKIREIECFLKEA